MTFPAVEGIVRVVSVVEKAKEPVLEIIQARRWIEARRIPAMVCKTIS